MLSSNLLAVERNFFPFSGVWDDPLVGRPRAFRSEGDSAVINGSEIATLSTSLSTNVPDLITVQNNSTLTISTGVT